MSDHCGCVNCDGVGFVIEPSGPDDTDVFPCRECRPVEWRRSRHLSDEVPLFDAALRLVMTCAAFRDVPAYVVACHEEMVMTTGFEQTLLHDDAFWILVLMKELQDAQ